MKTQVSLELRRMIRPVVNTRHTISARCSGRSTTMFFTSHLVALMVPTSKLEDMDVYLMMSKFTVHTLQRPYVLPAISTITCCIHTDAILNVHGTLVVDTRYQSLKLMVHYWWINLLNSSKLT